MKRWLRLALQIVSFLLFAGLLWWAGPEPWQEALAGERRALLLALLAHGAAGMVSGARLKLVSEGVARRPIASWRRFYHLNMGARALGLVLPRTLSAVGGKSAALRALQVPLQKAVWAVVIDNFFDVLMLGLLLLPALLWLKGAIGAGVFYILCAVLVLLLGAAMGWLLTDERLLALLALLSRIPWLRRRLAQVDWRVWLLPWQTAVAALGWTVLLNLLLVITYVYVGQALHITAPLTTYLAIFPVVQLSLIIAIAPGGLGIFDMSWLGLLVLSGLPQTEAATFTVVQRAYITVFVLLWTAVSFILAWAERTQHTVTEKAD